MPNPAQNRYWFTFLNWWCYVAWIVILISTSILKSLMHAGLIVLICVHHHKPVFNIVFCYGALYRLGFMTHLSVCSMYCITLKAWQTDPKGQFWYMHACVCVCVCGFGVPTADLLIDHCSPCCLQWALMLGGIDNLLPCLASLLCLYQNSTL